MSRWPTKNGWTQLELGALKPEQKGLTLADGGGLTGEVRVSGQPYDSNGDPQKQKVSVKWRYGFKWQGKKDWYNCGTWPLASMADIRAERDKARQLIKQGINPKVAKKVALIEKQAELEAKLAEAKAKEALAKTTWQLVETWLEEGVTRKDGNAELRRSFTKDMKPVVGDVLVKDLTYKHLRSVIAPLIERETFRSAQALYDNLMQLFKWAEQRQPWRSLMEDGNPMVLVDFAQMLPNDVDPNAPRERVLSKEEICELRDCFGAMKQSPDSQASISPENQLAIWICLATLSRVGELLMARWEDIDFKLHQWSIPAENTKRKRGGTRKDHLVVLSPLSLALFRLLETVTGHTAWCFPGMPDEKGDRSHVGVKTLTRLVGERQARFKESTKSAKSRFLSDSLVLSNGENGKWTPHDLRRTGATLMQELGIEEKIIDLCQNHVIEGPKVRKHYLHYPFFREQEKAWLTLGDHLAGVLGVDVSRFAAASDEAAWANAA